MARRLLILWHSRTGASEALAMAAADGAHDAAAEIRTELLPATRAMPDDLLAADACLFVGPENLAALSGAMKELCDRCYYPLLERIEGRAYAHIVAAGSDGAGAARQLARIATGWRMRAVAEPLIVRTHADTTEAILAPKTLPAGDLARATELGAMLAAGLAIGMF